MASLRLLTRSFHLALLRPKLLKNTSSIKPNLIPKFDFATSTLVLSNSSSGQEKEEMDELQKNPYFGKYAAKIDQMRTAEPDNFQAKLDALVETKQKQLEKQKEKSEESKDFSFPTAPKKTNKDKQASMRKQRKLEDYMKLELLTDRSSEEISDIWRQHHQNKPVISASIPATIYREMSQRFKQYPTFLVPLPRQEGYEFFVVQFEGNEAHFTSLINYHAHKEDAAECLTMVHYDELIESRGLVLMLGEIDSNLLSLKEAQCLASQVEIYYGSPDEAKLGLLEAFNSRPEQFNHQDLIKQIEHLSL